MNDREVDLIDRIEDLIIRAQQVGCSFEGLILTMRTIARFHPRFNNGAAKTGNSLTAEEIKALGLQEWTAEEILRREG